MGGVCSTYRDELCAYRIFVREPKRKKPLGRPGLGWENSKMDLKEVRWGLGFC
jgi:hypothetical protein